MLPQVFLERMQGLLGSEYEEFLVSFDHEKYQALRLNPLKLRTESGRTDDSTVIEEKIQQTFRLHPVPWADNGYYYTKEDQPGKHPWHEAGLYYIQEPSAMAPVSLLSPQPGERILDLCAAPGGKSTQIASAMEGEGLLVTNEIHPARAKILSENVERMGIRNACVLNETLEHLADIFEEYFDRILVDAPCSGEGMFRKNEVACEEWSPENVQLCADRQDGILECAARMLVPGGRLVYSTCTFASAENEGSISRFLAMHEEFEIVPIDKKALGIPEGCDGIPGWYRYDSLVHPLVNGNRDASSVRSKSSMYSSVYSNEYSRVYYDYLKTPVQINNRLAILTANNPFLLNFMGIRYLETSPSQVPAGYRVLWENDTMAVSENESVLPVQPNEICIE